MNEWSMSPSYEEQPSDRPDVFGITDPGLEHPRNEDQFLVAELSHTLMARQTSLDDDEWRWLSSGPKGLLLAVADGVGSSRGADQASRIAVQTVTGYATTTMPWFLAPRTDQEDDAVEVSTSMTLPSVTCCHLPRRLSQRPDPWCPARSAGEARTT
jgi:serine/threonine protein phosphatase PrpC